MGVTCVLRVLVALFLVVTVQSNADAEVNICTKPDADSCKEYNIGSNTNHYCKQVWMKQNCCHACQEAREYFVPEVSDDNTYFCDPPCQNKGKCVGPATCRCKKGFSGALCEKGKGNKEDKKDDDDDEDEGNEISDSKKMKLQRQQGQQRRQPPAARNSFVGRNNHRRDNYEDYINEYYRNYYRSATRDRGGNTWGSQYFG